MTTEQNDKVPQVSSITKAILEDYRKIFAENDINNFNKYYDKLYFNNKIIEQLTEISLEFPLKWYCPNEKCHYNKNKFDIPLKEVLINNDNILFFCPKCEFQLYPCQNCLHFLEINDNNPVGYRCKKCGWLNIIDQNLIKILNLKSSSLFNIEQAVTVQCIISGKQYYESLIKQFYKDKDVNKKGKDYIKNNDDEYEESEVENGPSKKRLKTNNNNNNNNNNDNNNILPKELSNFEDVNNNSISLYSKNSEIINNDSSTEQEETGEVIIEENNNKNTKNKNKNIKNNKNIKKNNKFCIMETVRGKLEKGKEKEENNGEDERRSNCMDNKNLNKMIKNKNNNKKKDKGKGKEVTKENQNNIMDIKRKMHNNKENENIEEIEKIINEEKDQEPNENKNANKNKRKRRRKRRTNNEILLSKLRSEFIYDIHDDSKNKFEKSLTLYIIKLLQTPEILFTTIEKLQKYRLLNMFGDRSLIQNKLPIYSDFNIDIDSRTTINKAMDIVNKQQDELNYIKSNLKIRNALINYHNSSKIENLTYGINESLYVIIKVLLNSLEYINCIINQLISNINKYNSENKSIDGSMKWMNIRGSISSEEIKDIIKKYHFNENIEYSKNISSSVIDYSRNASLSYIDNTKIVSTASLFDIFNESISSTIFNDDRKRKDRINDNILNNSKINSSGKSSIYSSNSSDTFFSSQKPSTDYEKNVINIRLFHQLRQLYSIICQYILF